MNRILGSSKKGRAAADSGMLTEQIRRQAFTVGFQTQKPTTSQTMYSYIFDSVLQRETTQSANLVATNLITAK
jgi:hypothetical protein